MCSIGSTASAPLAETEKAPKPSDFSVHEQLGQGTYGRVFRATRKDKSKEESVALKIWYACDSIAIDKSRALVEREIEVHSQLEHPNIVRLYASFRTLGRIYMVLEYLDGCDLLTRLYEDQQQSIDESVVRRVVRQLCAALDYCHQRGVVHRDVKPANVLTDSKLSIFKLADFGWCTPLLKNLSLQVYTDLCGTSDYISPEMLLVGNDINGGGGYDYRVDVWALGVLVFELLTKDTPFYCESVDDTYRRIEKIDIEWPPDCNKLLSVDARNLIAQLLVKREQRLSLQQILQHPFCKE